MHVPFNSNVFTQDAMMIISSKIKPVEGLYNKELDVSGT
jgi:hypothetical protein